jgi:hypothetical protein
LHNANHPPGLANTQKFVKALSAQHDYFSMYPTCIRSQDIAAKLDIDLEHMLDQNLNRINDYKKSDYEQILHYLDSLQAKTVYVTLSESIPLYFLHSRSGKMPFNEMAPPTDQATLRQHIDDLFFKKSQNTWEQLKMKNVWDHRERMALNFRPFESWYFDVPAPKSVFQTTAHDLWFRGAQTFKHIMDYCEMAIDQDRYKTWQPVYSQWQQIQTKHLEFQLEHQKIIKAILDGSSMPIDLTFDEEIVIQHILIYQHGVNLKTWQLEKFPNNTQLLHQLLEPNIHPVQDIYNSRSTS